MEDIVYEIGQTLRMAKKQNIDPITLEELENALARTSANKAKGVDNISVNDIARLPVSGKQMLVYILNRAEAVGSWQRQIHARLGHSQPSPEAEI
eukprot:6345941-Pyramimonas_sp.AAC.1